MPSIKEILECPRCGCLILPDSTKCPKCGINYDGFTYSEVVDSIESNTYPSKLKVGNDSVEILVARYEFSCPQHGKVNVKSAVITPKIKCPFC